MSGILGFLSAVFWGLLVLSLLVFVHEGGHFLAARACGVRATEFFLGLPSRFKLSWKHPRIGTEFGITPVLLGGYTRICGMEGEVDPLLPDALALVQEKGTMRAADLASSLRIDEGRAYSLLSCLVDMGSIKAFYNPELGEYEGQREWPEAFVTLRRDANMLTEYDGTHDFSTSGVTEEGQARPVADKQEFFDQETSHTYRGKGFLPRVFMLAAGPLVNLVLALALITGTFMVRGFDVATNSNVLGEVVQGSLAEAAGIRAGDKILMLNGQNVSDWNELCDAIDAAMKPGASIPVAYERQGETFETTIEVPADGSVDKVGVVVQMETYHPSFPEALQFAFSYFGMVGSTIARIIMPQHTLEIVSQSSSIVGISAMASEAASSGLADLILFVGAISMSLGFMNLLPIPPLDGGKMLIEVIQLVMGKPLSTRMQSVVSYIGLAFFLFLFCFALRNDIMMLAGMS